MTMKGSKSENTSLHDKSNKGHRGMGQNSVGGNGGYHGHQQQQQHGGGYHGHPRRGGHGNGGYRGGHHSQRYHQSRGDQHHYYHSSQHQQQGYHGHQQPHHHHHHSHHHGGHNHQHVQQQQQHSAPSQQQQPPLPEQSMSPDHEELVRFVEETFESVRGEMEAAKKQGSQDGKVVYYQETETNPALRDFEPFDLEAWWGKRVYHNLTH